MIYVTRKPRRARQGYEIDDWWETGGPDYITVHEAGDEPEPTGLLDQHGNELCRVRDRLPMGFRLK